MGFFLRARGSLKKKTGLLRSSQIPLEQVVAAIVAATRGTPLEPVVYHLPFGDGVFAIALHPAAGPLRVESEGGQVMIETKTSTVGPGFHAFLVSVLEAAQGTLGVQWELSDDSNYLRD